MSSQMQKERDEARLMVRDLVEALYKTFWHEMGCASMYSDAACTCVPKPNKGDEFLLDVLTVATAKVTGWQLPVVADSHDHTSD